MGELEPHAASAVATTSAAATETGVAVWVRMHQFYGRTGYTRPTFRDIAIRDMPQPGRAGPAGPALCPSRVYYGKLETSTATSGLAAVEEPPTPSMTESIPPCP